MFCPKGAKHAPSRLRVDNAGDIICKVISENSDARQGHECGANPLTFLCYMKASDWRPCVFHLAVKHGCCAKSAEDFSDKAEKIYILQDLC